MSNQTKIGLLLGLGVILLVGIIISDHLATQSQNHITDVGPVVSSIAEINNTNQRTGIRNEFMAPVPLPAHEVVIANPQTAPATQLPGIMIGGAPVPPAASAFTSTTPGATAPVVNNVAMIPPQPATVGVPISPAQPQLVPPAAPAVTVTAIPSITTAVAPAPAAVPAPAAKAPQRTYTIKEGDTLASIAAATLGSRNRWKDLLDANTKTLGNVNNLKIGTTLVIPEQETKAAVAPAAAPVKTPAVAVKLPPRTYIVAKGDLLGSIAAKTMGSTRKVQALVDANRKVLPQGEKTVLRTGMSLVIPAQ